MTQQQNPLLKKSSQKHLATEFHLIRPEHFMPALKESIQESKHKINQLKTQSLASNFENVILALEASSEKVNYISTVFFNLLSAESNDELQKLAQEISPLLAEFSSDISLDPEIFKKIKEVYDNRHTLNLKGEALVLTEKTYKDFARNGALLNETEKEKLRNIDQELSQLSPKYSDHILHSTNQFELKISDVSLLKGLPDSALESALALAQQKSEPQGTYLFSLQAPSYIPFLTYAENRELREKMWRAYNSRASTGEFDNHELCLKIARLKFERAQVLGYSSHADFTLEERMAKSSEQVQSFLDRLLKKSLPAAQKDLEQVKDLIQELNLNYNEIKAWDYAFLSEKLKQKIYDFDEEELRPYFKLENVVDGVFKHAELLYDLNFKINTEIPVYHKDVKAYEVHDSKQNFIGLLYADFFPRSGKRNGAWMTSYRDQGLVEGKIQRPHISIVCNFTQPTPDKPSLLTLDEVRTLFHEFGHALHGLLSNCQYVSLSGTNVFWDFVELPSQIMENWVLEKEALDLFAKHYKTGESIPVELTKKIKTSSQFQAGYASLRQIQFAKLDMAWFSTPPEQIKSVESFEEHILSSTRLLPKIEGTNLSCSFSHIFAGGYSAGYYSYKWAEVLDADAFELFLEKGLFNKDVAQKFKEHILSRGGTEHPMDLYKKFRGREPDPEALLRRDGLVS